MKRRAFGWMLLPVLLMSLPSFAGETDEAEVKKIAGTWRFVSLESDGQKAPDDVIKDWRWKVEGKEITWSDPQHGDTKTSLEVDASKSPKALDLTSTDPKAKGKLFKCIYEFNGERLRICIPEGKQAENDRPRPVEFSGGQGMSLLVLERVKD